MLNVGDSEPEARHDARPSCWSSASTASARRRPSASWPISLYQRGQEGAALRGAIRSAPRRPISSKFGPERADADIVRQQRGRGPRRRWCSTPSRRPRRAAADVILCDTAGRLHNKANLMNELGKISRIIDRELPDARQGGPARAGRARRARTACCRPSSSRRSRALRASPSRSSTARPRAASSSPWRMRCRSR